MSDYVEANEFKGNGKVRQITLPNEKTKPNQNALYYYDGSNIGIPGLRLKFQKRETEINFDGANLMPKEFCVSQCYVDKREFGIEEQILINLAGETDNYSIGMKKDAGKTLNLLNQLGYMVKNNLSLNDKYLFKCEPSVKDWRYNGIAVYAENGVKIPQLYDAKELVKLGVWKNTNKIEQNKKKLEVLTGLFELVEKYFNSNAPKPQKNLEVPPEIQAKQKAQTVDMTGDNDNDPGF